MPGGKKHGTKYIQSPLAGPRGGPNPTDEGLREENHRSNPLALLFAWPRSKGWNVLVIFLLKKYISLHSPSPQSLGYLGMSIYPHPKASEVAAWGAAPDRRAKSCDLWLLHLHGGGMV